MLSTEFFVRRRVATFILWVIPFAVGFYSMRYHLPIDLFPEINFPVVTVTTRYENVAPGEIESQITKPIEESVASIEGITSVRSRSAEGVSFVILEFEYDHDLDKASVNIRERLDRIIDQLPDDAESPIIEKFDINLLPVISLDLFGPELDRTKQVAEDVVKPMLESLGGVASAKVIGGLDREIQINIDPHRLEAYNLPIQSVIDAIGDENLNTPAGKVEEPRRDYLIRTLGQYETLDEIRNTVITTLNKSPVRIKDVATVKDGFADVRELSRFNGQSSVSVEIRKESGGNSVAVADAVRDALPGVRDRIPPDITLEVSADNSTYIKDSISMVADAAWQGALLAMIVLLLFLRSIRSTLVIAITIPCCLVSSFFPMYLLDMTLNLCSLGGLALGTGMVVDNAIVVLENIFRHRGLAPNERRRILAVRGTKEVGPAVAASTLTTLAVYFPIVFVKGIAGEIFADLALAVLFSLTASLFVAMTLIPMLTALFGMKPAAVESRRAAKPKRPPSFFARFFNTIWSSCFGFYKWMLDTATARWFTRLATVGAVIALFVIVMKFFAPPLAFFPKMDQELFNVQVELPVGSTLDRTDRSIGKLEDILLDIPEVRHVATRIDGNEGTLLVTILNRQERDRSVWAIMDDFRERAAAVPEAEARAREGDGGEGSGGDYPVELQIAGPDDEVLRGLAEKVLQRISVLEGEIWDMRTSFDAGKPELQLRINRRKAADLGLTTREIANAVEAANLGKVAGLFRVGDDEYDIRVRVEQRERENVGDLENIWIVSTTGLRFLLSDIAHFVYESGPVAIDRDDQQRVAFVWAMADEDHLEEVNASVMATLEGFEIPPGYRIEQGGQFEEMGKAFAQLGYALVFAIILVFCVLAAQFESFTQPFIIMTSVPMSLIGVNLLLSATGKTMSLAANVGVIMLAGIVVNNAILLIDYANQLHAQGKSPLDSIREAGRIRFRPVLMTTLTTVLGMMPLATGLGSGNEFFQPMAVTVIGGISASTLITLVFVPVLYVFVEDARSFFRRLFLGRYTLSQNVPETGD